MRVQYLGLDEEGDIGVNSDFKQKIEDGYEENAGEGGLMKGKRGEDQATNK